MERNHLSVAMCTYNGARFLAEQLESIATQTRLPDELVVCDDCSTDGSVEILKSFARHSPFAVRLEINKNNLGSTKNFEKAIGLCQGEVIALADQDDIWYSKKLERIEAVFADRPSVGVVFSDADVVDENKIPLGFRLWRTAGLSPARRKRISNGQATKVLLNRNVVTGASMAFRARFRNLVLPIPMCWVHDAWIVLLISAVADLGSISEALIRYRKHSGQQIGPLDFTITDHFAHAKRTGAREYYALAQQFRLARERLLTVGDDARVRAVIPDFEMKIKHLENRARAAAGGLLRLPRILEELLLLRYHRYSKGWKSAARDLLFSAE